MIDAIAFTPPWLKVEGADPETLPAFDLRAGSIIERDQLEAELEGRFRGGLVLPHHLLDAAARGAEALLGADEAQPVIESLRAEYGGEVLPPEERARIKEASDILAEHWPDYRALREQEARRNGILPTLAFMRWCTGWRNLRDDAGEIAFARGAQGIDDALLRRVPFVMMRAAGLQAYALQYGKAQEKN